MNHCTFGMTYGILETDAELVDTITPALIMNKTEGFEALCSINDLNIDGLLDSIEKKRVKFEGA